MGDAVLYGASHARIQDPLEVRQSGAVGQDHIAQATALYRAIVFEQVMAEAIGNCGSFRRARRVQRVHQAVGVDVVGAEALGEQLTDRALAAGDIARQSEKKYHFSAFCYTYTRSMHLKPTADNTIVLKSPREIAIMREAGKIVAQTIRALEEQAQPGMTTRDLDQIAAQIFKHSGAESTALGYFGYPGHICVSVNDEVVHGIPGPRKLKRGDLVKVDVAARFRGYVGDSTHCFAIGGLDTLAPRARELVQVTQEALFHGIDQARAGNRLSDIGAAIEAHVRKHGMSVVRDFVGHGVGRNMHEAPPGESRLTAGTHARRRLDGRHRRRQPERAFRAHRGGDQRRA